MKIAVHDWMTPDPVSIEPEASALAALELMVDCGTRHLPVVDPAGRVVGILTSTDLRSVLDEAPDLHAAPDAATREQVRDYTVAEIMSHAPATTTADASLEDAAGRMASRRFGCLPVVEDSGTLIGILSETDALVALVALLSLERGGRSPDTLARIDTVERTLRAERWRILQRLSELARTGREQTGEQRDQVLDSAERGADLQAVELDERLADLGIRRLEALDRALDRAAQGRLGICDGCGSSIPIARLRALPGTTVCIRCARGRERPAGGPSAPPPGLLPGLAAGIGGRVHTPQGEGRLLRVAAFGTCGSCGETEGRYDEDEDAVLCVTPGCGLPLVDVVELAVVEIADEVISLPPEQLGKVDSQPYD